MTSRPDSPLFLNVASLFETFEMRDHEVRSSILLPTLYQTFIWVIDLNLPTARAGIFVDRKRPFGRRCRLLEMGVRMNEQGHLLGLVGNGFTVTHFDRDKFRFRIAYSADPDEPTTASRVSSALNMDASKLEQLGFPQKVRWDRTLVRALTTQTVPEELPFDLLKLRPQLGTRLDAGDLRAHLLLAA